MRIKKPEEKIKLIGNPLNYHIYLPQWLTSTLNVVTKDNLLLFLFKSKEGYQILLCNSKDKFEDRKKSETIIECATSRLMKNSFLKIPYKIHTKAKMTIWSCFAPSIIEGSEGRKRVMLKIEKSDESAFSNYKHKPKP